MLIVAALALLFGACAAVMAVADDSTEGPAGTETTTELPPWLREVAANPPKSAEANRRGNKGKPLSQDRRKASQTALRQIGAAAAAESVKRAFPGLVRAPIRVGPKLRSGERVVAYPEATVARVRDNAGRRSAAVSTLPMVRRTQSGQRAPVDLGLKRTAKGFSPRNPLIALNLPERLSQGVGLGPSRRGLALTPLNEAGRPLKGRAREINDTAVLYANTELDSDTLVKPLPAGVETNTLLRSPVSPEHLFFGVQGQGKVTFAQAADGSVEVRRGAETIAFVPNPAARDATGALIPVTMQASDTILELTVEHREGSFAYPIDVDPTVVAPQSFASGSGNWLYQTSNPSTFHHGSDPTNGLVAWGSGATYYAGHHGYWAYATQGTSRITRFQATTFAPWYAGDQTQNTVGIVGGAGWETSQYLGYSYGVTESDLFAAGSNANVAIFQQYATAAGTAFSSRMPAATLTIDQFGKPQARINRWSYEINGHPNAMQGASATARQWVRSSDNAYIGLEAEDDGMGIYRRELYVSSDPNWNGAIAYGSTGTCVDVQCDQEYKVNVPVGNLSEGSHWVVWKAEIATGANDYDTLALGVDNTAPAISVEGLPADGMIGLGDYSLDVDVTDGELGKTAQEFGQSGMPSGFTVAVDGETVFTNEDKCGLGSAYPGDPCQISDGYTLKGRDIGYGSHVLEVRSEARAGNVGIKEIPFTIKDGPMVDMGPGSLDIMSGGFSLSATDVAESGSGTGLSVFRSHHSLNTGLDDSPFGPSWQLSLGGWRGVTRLPDGDAVFTDARGRVAVFQFDEGGQFTPPSGYEGFVLSYQAESPASFVLKDASGNVTTFKRPEETGDLYLPASFDGPGGTDATIFEFEMAGGVAQPVKVVGPAPAGVDCEPLERGCRALTFEYAESTTASGERPEEWGDYEGRLVGVELHAWDPAEEQMTAIEVVRYAYDDRGRLRGVWDPRISPRLVTTYGYDEEGRVTAVGPPGQQPWLLRYGAVPGGGDSRRLISASRPKESVVVGEAAPPSTESTPPLSHLSPVAGGAQLQVSVGEWADSPLEYSYQWVRCNATLLGCKPIPGALGRSYQPKLVDVGMRLHAEVIATNAGGSTAARSRATAPVAEAGGQPNPAYAFDLGGSGSGEGQFEDPGGIAVDPSANVWVIDSGNDRVEKFAPDGEGGLEFVAAYGSSGAGPGQFNEPTGIAADYEGNVFVADTGNNRIVKLNASGEAVLSFGEAGTESGQFNEPTQLAFGGRVDEEILWVIDRGNLRLQSFVDDDTFAGEIKSFEGTAASTLQEPVGIAVDSEGFIYVADAYFVLRVLKFWPWGKLNQEIGSDSEFWGFSDLDGEFGYPGGLAIGLAGTDWADSLFAVDAGAYPEYEEEVDNGRRRIQIFDSDEYQSQFLTQIGSKGSGVDQLDSPRHVAVGLDAAEAPKGLAVYIAESANDRIQAWRTDVEEEQTLPPETSNVAWTAAYHVPTEGEGAPHQMGEADVSEWAQNDIPTDATAIFPPDQVPADPVSPADYRRAAIYYMDPVKRIVNTRSPGGRINVEEHGSTENVVRTLSAANRQRVLDLEGSKAERQALAAKIDTQHTYSQNGTELAEVLGPLHKVELEDGSTVQARLRTKYTYDENAPAGGPYHLVTRQTEGAWIPAIEEEADVRTKLFHYDGQEKLGWELRKPTATITDPAGLHLVEKSQYDPESGKLVMTSKPADPDNESGHAEETIYYASGASEVEACGERPEWDGLPCQTGPAEQDPQGEAQEWRLTEISCANADSCVAIGRYEEPEARQMPPVLRWDGTEWTEQSIPVPGEATGAIELNDVFCGAPERCYAVGAYHNGLKFVPLVVTGNGSEWLVESVAAPSGDKGAHFEAVTCTWHDEYEVEWCTAAGHYTNNASQDKGLIATGAEGFMPWASTSLSTPSGVSKVHLKGISCAGDGSIAESCVAAGHFYYPALSRYEQIAYHRTGTWPFGLTWSLDFPPHHLPGGQGVYLNDVSCTLAGEKTDCAVVGNYTNQFSEDKPLATNWDGAEEWSEYGEISVPTPAQEAQLEGVACRAADTCTAVGIMLGETAQSLIIELDPEAAEWSVAEAAKPKGSIDTELDGISCPETELCIAVGSFTKSTEMRSPYVAEWNGSEWTVQWVGPDKAEEPPGTGDAPLTTTSYNVYNQPVISTEEAGEAVRTATIEYDDAGRAVSTAIAATEGESLPTTHIGYDEQTGMPTVQSTETEAVVSGFDAFGRLISYLDADGNTTTYEYDEDSGALLEIDDGKGSRSFGYDAVSGDLTKVEDSTVGTFTAEYDADGGIVGESFPNGMDVSYSYDATGTATSVDYVKTSNCEEDCTWFSDEVTPSIHGQVLSQQSTFGNKAYEYDSARRLLQVEETPIGQGCTTTLYEYDENTNRTGTTVRGPAEGGGCASTGGATETNAFDAADRLVGEGVSYNAFGATTSLPADDAGGSALSATYYADDTIATLSQGGRTLSYALDPEGRIRETAESGSGEGAEISHFAGPGDSPAWTEDGSGGWTRYVGGVGGTAAIQRYGQEAELQVVNLHGDVVATAPLDAEAEGLTTSEEASPFGVPSGESPAKYSWLGAAQRPTELSSGVINIGARTYVPQLGRFLQVDPVPGGSANAYAYTHGDPVNETDLSGEYTPSLPTWLAQYAANPPYIAPPQPSPADEVEMIDEAISEGDGTLLAGAAITIRIPTPLTGGCIVCTVAKDFGWFASEAVKAVKSLFRLRRTLRGLPRAVRRRVLRSTKRGIIAWAKEVTKAEHREVNLGCVKGALEHYAQVAPTPMPPKAKLGYIAAGCIVGYLPD